MTREQIEKEARGYISDVYAGDGYFLPDYEEEVRDGFIAGANWRINSVWHDGNVSCQTRRKALVLFKNGNASVYNDLRDLTFERMWGEVDKFAYIDDLMPDRKEADQ